MYADAVSYFSRAAFLKASSKEIAITQMLNYGMLKVCLITKAGLKCSALSKKKKKKKPKLYMYCTISSKIKLPLN